MLSGVGDILGAIHCIELLKRTDTFLDWLSRYHQLRAKPDWIDSYKIALDVFFGLLEEGIAANQSLNLTEDTLLTRALFAGVPLQYVPNSCEKAILLRVVFERSRTVLKGRTWEELSDFLSDFDENILTVLNSIRQSAYVHRGYRVRSVDEGIKYSAMFQLYIFLNDTSRGRPHGLGLSLFEGRGPRIWPHEHLYRVPHVFEGYKYCVQFLWYLLRGERLDQKCLADLDKPANWSEFDRFFEPIKETIINPMERETGSLLGFDSVLKIHPNAKASIERLLRLAPPETHLSPKALLERQFLWYDIKLINAQNSTFSGVPAFVPMLIGSVRLQGTRKRKDSLKIIRLMHPTGYERRHDYSYAVLSGVTGTFGLTDYSGWLLFFDCCADAGSTSPLFRVAEQYLRRYERQGRIEVQTIMIDKRRFLSLMKRRIQSG